MALSTATSNFCTHTAQSVLIVYSLMVRLRLCISGFRLFRSYLVGLDGSSASVMSPLLDLVLATDEITPSDSELSSSLTSTRARLERSALLALLCGCRDVADALPDGMPPPTGCTG